jgi:hypothetical protein
MMDRRERLLELDGLLTWYEYRIQKHVQAVEYLAIERLFEKYVRNDAGEFASYLSTKKIKKKIVFTRDDVKDLADGVNQLQLLDFAVPDDQQKTEVVDYLSYILDEIGVLQSHFDVSRAFFVYAAHHWLCFLEDTLEEDSFDRGIAEAHFRIGYLLAQADLCVRVTDKSVLENFQSQKGRIDVSKRYTDKQERAKKAIEFALKSQKDGSKETNIGLAQRVCAEVDAERIGEVEQLRIQRDKKLRKPPPDMPKDEFKQMVKDEFSKATAELVSDCLTPDDISRRLGKIKKFK